MAPSSLVVTKPVQDMGLMRSREFIMKDAYSFDRTPEDLEEAYRLQSMRAYVRTFTRCTSES